MDSDDDEPPMLVEVAADAASEPAQQQQQAQHSQQGEKEEEEEMPPCPVTILSGFLGSGKTTLIQYILQSPDHGKRIAVIENEFGEGVAVESLIARDGVDPSNNSLTDFLELPNGCICCTVKDNLVMTLESLLQKRKDLDYILIEASGMANPGPIASVFWLDDQIQSRLRLDGIVTLVDAYHIRRQLEETEEAAQQIAHADRILCNKVDLLGKAGNGSALNSGGPSRAQSNTGAQVDTEAQAQAQKQVLKVIRDIHPMVPIQCTSFSKVPDLNWILDTNCFDGKDRLGELEEQLERAVQVEVTNDGQCHEDHEHDHTCRHNHRHHHSCVHSQVHTQCVECTTPEEEQISNDKQNHKHTNSISTISLRHTGTMQLSKLNAWLASILWPQQDELNEVLDQRLQSNISTHNMRSNDTTMRIFRMKGILSVFDDDDDTNGNCKYILQAVHDLWDVYPAQTESFGDTPRQCQIVVIGKQLQRKELLDGFHDCFLNGATDATNASASNSN